ncbi:MAG TPA: sigma 54-interacting transcriptional regulator [Polyangiaceae bacterium]|nr:sigma 54-interacting transcriptional regulator [Polyangiaceae bacterium]
MATQETSEESQRAPNLTQGGIAGLIVIWAHGRPACLPLPLTNGELVLGRGVQADLFAGDERVSREHCRLGFDGTLWTVSDLASRNGTFLRGQAVEGAQSTAGEQLVLRVGRTLLWAVDDVRLYRGGVLLREDGLVIGGSLRRAWAEIELAAHAGSTLCLRGESGAGKERAARAFHEASFGDRAAPFVGVNCAAIPEGLAERLLFGAKRGAYSGAASDVQGYLQAAHRGTLFLDEIAELEPRTQAKLLRVLETKEVLPLGANRPESVDLRVCVAAHADLREEVRAGRFREDLYYRIGRPEVMLAPLRQRLDELPWLITALLTAVSAELYPSARLIETCATRPWPGNVRELSGVVRRAAHRALRLEKCEVDLDALEPDAGLRLSEQTSASLPDEPKGATMPGEEQILRALSECDQNVTQAARQLGLHRNQLRRWLAKRAVNSPPKPGDEE